MYQAHNTTYVKGFLIYFAIFTVSPKPYFQCTPSDNYRYNAEMIQQLYAYVDYKLLEVANLMLPCPSQQLKANKQKISIHFGIAHYLFCK